MMPIKALAMKMPEIVTISATIRTPQLGSFANGAGVEDPEHALPEVLAEALVGAAELLVSDRHHRGRRSDERQGDRQQKKDDAHRPAGQQRVEAIPQLVGCARLRRSHPHCAFDGRACRRPLCRPSPTSSCFPRHGRTLFGTEENTTVA